MLIPSSVALKAYERASTATHGKPHPFWLLTGFPVLFGIYVIIAAFNNHLLQCTTLNYSCSFIRQDTVSMSAIPPPNPTLSSFDCLCFNL